MSKRTKLISLSILSLIAYIYLNYYFTFFTIENRITKYSEEMSALNQLLKDMTQENLISILVIITIIVTTLSLLVQYLVGIFLLMLFTDKVKSQLFYALIPKIIIMSINVIFIVTWQIYDSWLYLTTALVGSILIMFLFQYKKQNWKASILFSIAFILDPVISIVKEISTL
nr:hypothetical protein [Priestia flexa]WEZ10400.1 hypothetical protein P5663_21060 [Priestia flexa]WEZ10410.1 hypothetical protein P5663_21005 [Priestia flexa]